jgi:hypothetical protein
MAIVKFTHFIGQIPPIFQPFRMISGGTGIGRRCAFGNFSFWVCHFFRHWG